MIQRDHPMELAPKLQRVHLMELAQTIQRVHPMELVLLFDNLRFERNENKYMSYIFIYDLCDHFLGR
jgi:predicted AAA+ superfamily ATPase